MDADDEKSVYMLKLRHTGTPNVGGGEGAMWDKDVSYTLSTTQDQTMFVPDSADNFEYVVRRLTPDECERLQGFPTGWTSLRDCDVDAVTERVAASFNYSDEERERLRRKVRKWASSDCDSPRYKCAGNSMAVPVMRWIGERIQRVDALLSSKEGEDGTQDLR